MKIRASRKYGLDWLLTSTNTEGTEWSLDRIQIILLSEIRDELKTLNTLLGCRNFRDIPTRLRAIDRELKQARKGQ